MIRGVSPIAAPSDGRSGRILFNQLRGCDEHRKEQRAVQVRQKRQHLLFHAATAVCIDEVQDNDGTTIHFFKTTSSMQL
jgi:hypothetical protein